MCSLTDVFVGKHCLVISCNRCCPFLITLQVVSMVQDENKKGRYLRYVGHFPDKMLTYPGGQDQILLPLGLGSAPKCQRLEQKVSNSAQFCRRSHIGLLTKLFLKFSPEQSMSEQYDIA